MDEHASDLATFVGSLKTRPVLVGHSFGGTIVQVRTVPALYTIDTHSERSVLLGA